MNEKLGFLSDKLARYDLVLVKVLGAPRPQTLRAKVQRIYTSGKGINTTDLGSEIEFVRSSGAWGNMTLAVGQQALLFIELISGKLYEDPWRGHLIIEQIEENSYAIFQFKELWFNESVPPLIREFARQDPKRSYATAIRFYVLETYFLSLIERIER